MCLHINIYVSECLETPQTEYDSHSMLQNRNRLEANERKKKKNNEINDRGILSYQLALLLFFSFVIYIFALIRIMKLFSGRA